MERSPLQSKRRGLQKNERYEPYVRWNKETDEWVYKAIKVDTNGDEEMEETAESTIEILMTRSELDIIARLVAYMYHDKIDEYKEIASDMRKDHIYKDLRSINMWLNSQYQQLEKQDEQSKQKKRQYVRT